MHPAADASAWPGSPDERGDRGQRSALRHLLNTFFEGSATQAIAAFFDEDAEQLTDDDGSVC